MRADWRRRAHSVAALRLMAKAALPRAVFDFADGAAEDESALSRNETAFDGWDFLPKPLDGSPQRDLSVELFGHRLSMPVMIGPTGLSGLFAPDGERCAARAAHAAETGFCLSHASVCTLEQLAETGATPRWMQVFIYRDRGFTAELARRAHAAGYHGLVLTIDNQLLGNRERDLRNGFTIPPNFSLVDRAKMLTKVPWLIRMRTEIPRVTFANYVRPGEPADVASLAGRMNALLDPSMNWADVAALRNVWTGPLLLKGVLHPDEAARALDYGMDGLIVSNHGGRQLDGAIASLDALPGVLDAVQGRIPVLVDGGIRRGADVVKALALGARCCLIARPQLWGLAVAGEEGVAHVLDIFRREIDRTMGLLGVTSVAGLGRHLLARRTRHG
ncbi:MAG: alpha-hydroxy acid oxidase [Alsobacter sp.]